MTNVTHEVRNYFKLELLSPRSCVILRQLFKQRYSQFYPGQIWDDTPACGNAYLTNVVAKNKKLSLTSLQKTSVSNGNSNEWDSTVLTNLLLFGDRPNSLTTAEIQRLDQEDAQIKQLKDFRNELSHKASKSISDAEFHQMWTILSTILVTFGDDGAELDKLKDDDIFAAHPQPVNEENVKEASRLNSLGTQAHKNEQFSEAIIFFIEATVLPSISSRDRAVFFSNMSSSRLALYEQSSNRSTVLQIDDISDGRYRALQDAKQARNLWSTWWKGHFRVGKVYAALNEHVKAIRSFERALALVPTNNDIQKALDESRDILSRQQRHDHLDPRLTPKTMSEHLKQLQQTVGIAPEEVRKSHRLLEQVDPVGVDVVKGHKYEHGDDDVKQDYEQAARYFAKAASQGNAEGMYNLARLTSRGLGVKKDHRAALKLLEQAAAQSYEHPKLKGARNVGVAEAEHSLGLRYYGGISVHKDYPTAAYWYQRAVEHGSAESANNLAIMYQDGIGVERNFAKAQQLFELAARRRDPNAMARLAQDFLDNNDLQMAKMWYDRACDYGHNFALTNRDGFEKLLQHKQQVMNQSSPDTLKMLNAMKNFTESVKESKTVHKQLDQPRVYDYNVLNEHASRGSVTAKRMCAALEHFSKAFAILMQMEPFTDHQENTFVHELAQCYRLEHIVAQFPGIKYRQKTEQIVDGVLHRCSKQSHPAVSQLDEDARICYAVLYMDSQVSTAQFLEASKQKYPQSIFFFELSSAVYGWLKHYEASLYDTNTGLELDPKHCELLYHKAVALRLIGQDTNETIDAYQAFLAVAPRDHRKVPEAYYAMANCYAVRDNYHDVIDIVKQIYQQGEEAEKMQLPCFLPYKTNSKTLLKAIIDPKCLFDTESTPMIDRKLCLTNPHRVEVITRHRNWMSKTSRIKSNPNLVYLSSTHQPRVKQETVRSLIGLKPITLREMNPTKDHVYDGYVLSVTIIEEARSWIPSIHLVIEDEHFDCEHMCIYNCPEEQGEYSITKVFIIGSKMHVINPYLRLGAKDMKPMIRIDDFSSVIMQSESERVVNMCRCCREANAPHACSKCQRARYCTKECQTIDWKLYKHKLICQSQ